MIMTPTGVVKEKFNKSGLIDSNLNERALKLEKSPYISCIVEPNFGNRF